MAEYVLPLSVATRTQVVNVLRNLEEVLDKGVQNSIRADEGVDFQDLPEVSSALAEIVKENNLDVSTDNLRSLGEWLQGLKHDAPVVRFTFASDPTNDVVSRLVKWLRDNTKKIVLIRTSIQPTLAAGCIMHTPSHQYDFSLRNQLLEGIPIFKRQVNAMLDEQAKQTRIANAKAEEARRAEAAAAEAQSKIETETPPPQSETKPTESQKTETPQTIKAPENQEVEK